MSYREYKIGDVVDVDMTGWDVYLNGKPQANGIVIPCTIMMTHGREVDVRPIGDHHINHGNFRDNKIHTCYEENILGIHIPKKVEHFEEGLFQV